MLKLKDKPKKTKFKMSSFKVLSWACLALTICSLQNAAGLAMPEVGIPNDDWVACNNYKEMITMADCLCQVTEDEAHFRVNCDHVVFGQDFPVLPFRQPVQYFSHRFVSHQNVPPQAFAASSAPLQVLDLSNNLLRRLTEKSLEGLAESLELLDLSSNLLGDQLNPIFSTGEFKRLPRLKILKLGHNLLFDIDAGILDGCLSLQELHLDNNELRRVPKQSLKGPNQLKLLSLNHNHIDILNPDDFSTQPSLLLANISNNRIHTIQGNAFRSMANLRILDLSWNRIQRLNSDSFQGLYSVEAVDLSFNYLSQIPITALKSLTTLRGLRLTGNEIQSLEPSQLKQLSNLEILDLSRNRINDIPKGFFNGLVKLKEINLGVNQLRTMQANAFEGLPNLVRLNLGDNNLLTFPSSVLEPLTTLNTLVLDYNRISALVPMKMQNLTKLSLSNNLIREIPSDTFENFPQLRDLNMYGNLIESMDDVVLPSGLRELNLGLNNLKAVPRFFLHDLEVLKLQKNLLPALSSHNFVLLSSLRELDLSSNLIASFEENSFDGLENLEELDMSGNNLETVPTFGNLEMLVTLNFSKNYVKEVGNMENMENLQVLDLSSNSIGAMKPGMFLNTSNLEILSLKNNKLVSFKGFEGTFNRMRDLNLAKNQISYVYPSSFENFPDLWILDLSDNRFNVFPTEFVKQNKQLRSVDLSGNQIKSLDEMNFSNFPHMRNLDLSHNLIEYLPQDSFLNSSQLQHLDFSYNKIESVDGNVFHGLYRMDLDLSHNYVETLPSGVFDRKKIHKLHSINLSKNLFTSIPSDALQKQYFYLETLDLSDNNITHIPSNLNILVNVKSLDLSQNPLSDAAIKTVLNEPKTARHINLADTNLKTLPVLEMPFLRSLNLSNNRISSFEETVFKRTTLLHHLFLDQNNFEVLQASFPASLRSLDLSTNPLTAINGTTLPTSLENLKLNHLESIYKIEKANLNLKNLITLEIYNMPKLGYLDIRGLLTNLKYLENFDFEVKDAQIVDQIHPGLNARVKNIGLRGRRIRSISTGAFAGLTSPTVRISLINTSLALLPSILVPVPMSSSIALDLTGSKITNLSPPFLSQNIKLEGLSPTCDCNAVNLVKYLKNVESNVICSAPKNLAGVSVLDLTLEDLVCDVGGSTTPPPIVTPTALTTTTPAPTTPDDIIWSMPPTNNIVKKASAATSGEGGKKGATEGKNAPGGKASKVTPQDITNMDNLIIGIVGGVVALILAFIFVIICCVKCTGKRDSDASNTDLYPAGAPSIISVAPGYGAGSKCTCPYTGKPMTNTNGFTPYYMAPANYSTVRSDGKAMQAYPSMPTAFTSGMYALGGGPGSAYLGGGPPAGYPASLSYGNNRGGDTLGHSSMRNHQQQQQTYASLPYYIQDEYDSRR